MESRRKFVLKVAAGVAATGLVSLPGAAKGAMEKSKKIFVHHVFFWLKDPENPEARKQFEKGLEELIKVPLIRFSHVGCPVESSREVVDDSFTYSYMVFFDTREDQNLYQTHPIHLKFIADCQHLWTKVVVYDAIN